ncbi:CaiB/BaiF CoA transferase family protein [Chloroflexota bacterium]
MAGPLDGIRVLDLTQILSGPFATMLLCDMGAEVIKIEKPKIGDISRGTGPTVKGLSTYFLSLNRGKKSITLNLNTKKGVELLRELTKDADVLTENFTPGTMRKLGLDYNEVKKHNPKIIYVSCSGFGQNGPYVQKPAFDITIQAMGGIMSITGEEGGPPIRPGVSYGDITAGLFLTIATLAAIQERHKSGEGQYVDISMLDCQLTALENAFVRHLNTGEIPHALGTRHPLDAPFQAFETKDSYIALALRGGVKNQWPLFCAAIDNIHIVDDPRFQNGSLRSQNYKILEPILTKAMKAKTTGDWIKELEQIGIPYGPVNNIDQVAHNPQIAARDMIVNVHHHTAGEVKIVNNPFKFSRTPAEITRASPELGENTQEVLSQLLDITNDEIVELERQGII